MNAEFTFRKTRRQQLLCPRHRERACDIDHFSHHGSLQGPPPCSKTAAAPGGASIEKRADGLRKGLKRLRLAQLLAARQRTRPSHASAGSERHSSALVAVRDLSNNSVARDVTSGTCAAAVANGTASMNAEAANGALQQGAMLSTQSLRSGSAWGEFQAQRAYDFRSANLVATEINTMGLVTKGPNTRAEGTSGNDAKEDESGTQSNCGQCLWSYAFPHAEPVCLEQDELGLPTWWLNTHKVPSKEQPPVSDPAFLQSIRKKSSEQSRSHMRRRSRGLIQHRDFATKSRSVYRQEFVGHWMDELMTDQALGEGSRAGASPRVWRHRRVKSAPQIRLSPGSPVLSAEQQPQ